MTRPKTYWADTEFYGLLGNPTRESLSAAMHNANFESIGMNALYTPWDTDEEGMTKIISALTPLRFKGLNITMPLKQKIIPLLDELDDMGTLCKAVNTLYWKNGKLCGTNTDGVGFVQGLKEQGGYDPAGKSCLLFGSGGAARGVSFALCRAGVSSITLSDRASWLDNVQELASELNAYRQGVCRVQSVDPSERPDLFKQNELIINATSAGMAPNTDTTPFDTSLLESRHVVCDVVYVPHETKLLRDAGALGCKTLPGYWMMIWQGVEAFRRWMQERKPAIEPDVEVMTSTVLKSLTNRE